MDGEKNGTWSCFYESGQKEIEMDFVKGRKHGWVRRWHPDGKLDFENQWESGFQQGEFKHYHRDGGLWTHGFFDEKMNLHGAYDEFSLEGTPLLSLRYDHGRLHGLQKGFANGKSWSCSYQQGRPEAVCPWLDEPSKKHNIPSPDNSSVEPGL